MMAMMSVKYVMTSSLIFRSLSPRISTSRTLIGSRNSTQSRQLSLSLLPALQLEIPTAIFLAIPGWIGDLWGSVLRAVPKKKTSHQKKRSRQRAGKALKDVTALNKCSGCGHVKRWHTLCPYCVKEIQDMWKGKGPLGKTTSMKPEDSE